jgi:hypothetical protein
MQDVRGRQVHACSLGVQRRLPCVGLLEPVPAIAEITEGLFDLRLRVHHKRTVLYDWLVERLATNQNKVARFTALVGDVNAVAIVGQYEGVMGKPFVLGIGRTCTEPATRE